VTQKKTPKLSPREAVKLANKLGWTVEPKRNTGDIVFRSPDGERFTSRAPGRADRVSLRLARALHEAQQAVQAEKKKGGTEK
jgi:hypothetical protein